MPRYYFIAFLLVLVLAVGCKQDKIEGFRLISRSESGIDFRNDLKETVDFNLFNYMYFYNGAGVGVGDFNADGYVDIYFTSNQGANRLYINEQNFRFQDVTEVAGVAGPEGWKTGVSIADVNADGRLDIYVCYLGQYLNFSAKNKLYINQGVNADGIPIFSERASEYGLDLVGFSTQAVFFDYDRDGDLDMYMLNHSLHQNGTFGDASLRKVSHPLAGDKLLRNDNGIFKDVSVDAGIFSSVIGYGLGVTVSDVNLDGWSDIYVGNDFHENDYLYINQRDGTFKDVLEEAMPHTSRYTMGVDFADFNNDAYPDLIAMDMLPSDPRILKASQAEEPYDVYEFKLRFGYNHQFARNVLQVNNHDGTFSDVALLAGVSATDWSWSALFADFNLDGQKDIFVSNGIYRRSNDLDYINFITADSIQNKLKGKIGEAELKYIYQMPQIKIPNALFLNNGDSSFVDKANEWGLATPSYSNGTAYADFDNDGDLDIVINNINDEAFLYENLFKSSSKPIAENHSVQILLKGAMGNTHGIGAKIFLFQKGLMQFQECMPVRGYLSSVDYKLTFGLGSSIRVDSVMVVWPDGRSFVYKDLAADTLIQFDQEHAKQFSGIFPFKRPKTTFLSRDTSVFLSFKHNENRFVQFNRDQLIPHMFSEEGPAVAIADVNRDGLDDVFLGGSRGQPAGLFVQDENARFIKLDQQSISRDSAYEDVDALFFDADGDTDQDLFVVSGGDEFWGKSIYRISRLYLNDGKGHFEKSKGLPDVYMMSSCVAANDIDNDGDVDLFLGARTTTLKYGVKPSSSVLVNDGKGNFQDKTQHVAPDLLDFGFVKNAIWADVVEDSEVELVIAAEWAPISIFKKMNGKLNLISSSELDLTNTSGWWNVVKTNDVDNDGDLDLIAGNLGLNSKLKANKEHPVQMYVADFDKNGQVDQIITHYINGDEYPFNTRDELTKQMPYLKKRFLSYKTFANATVNDVFGDNLRLASKFEVTEFRSCLFRNENKRKFSMEPLPTSVQFSTLNAIQEVDFNRDGFYDFVLGGNFYPINIQMGRNDGSYGNLLMNKGNGTFSSIPAIESGFSVKGQVRNIKQIKIGLSTYLLVIRNNETVEFFRINVN